jgi:hypothetical protein
LRFAAILFLLIFRPVTTVRLQLSAGSQVAARFFSAAELGTAIAKHVAGKIFAKPLLRQGELSA